MPMTTSKTKKPATHKSKGSASAPSHQAEQKKDATGRARSTSTTQRTGPKSPPNEPFKRKEKSVSKRSLKGKDDSARNESSSPPRMTKQDAMLALLSRDQGATLAELVEASGWQKHSVHGFLSGTVKKKLSLPLSSVKSNDGLRRYRIATGSGN